MPSVARWLGIAAITLCSVSAVADPLKPYVVLMLDTSGSMVNTPGAVTGSGPPSCGGADLRLNHARCAINKIVNSYGDMVFALGRFRETGGGDYTTPNPDSCDANGNGQGGGADGCTTSGVDCNACSCNGRTEDCSACSTSLYADHRGEMLTGLVDGGNQAAATWTDFTCASCGGQGTSLASQPEIWGAGSWTPLGGYLASASRYWRGQQATNGNTIWPDTSAGFDPIRNDPTKTAFLPLGCDPNPTTCGATNNCCATQCRPYITIMLTDGAETCGGNAVPVAQSMLSTVVDNRAYRIETKVIGFGLTPGDPDIEAYAQAGGAPDLPGAYEGYYANDEASLQLALSQILADAVKVETCNDIDDDCDGMADEDFLPPTSVPGKGGTCTNGQLGICARTGTLVCRADGAGLECNAPTVTAGNESTMPCNSLDDDCDGRVDEGQTCTNCIPTGETCDGMDNDCDGVADQICRCSNDINVRCDGVGNDCGGSACDCSPLVRPCGIGACAGTEQCTAPNTWTGCTADTPDPNGESCNGLDDDCDGLCDGFSLDCSDVLTPGGPASDSPGSPDHYPTADVGESGADCADNVDDDKDGFVNDGCPANGAPETGADCANATDDDGDMDINDGCPVPSLPIAENICRPGVKTCSLGCTQPKAFGLCSGETRPCNGQTPCTDPCNGFDDDCDNKIDEGFVPADCSTNCGIGQTSCSNGTIVCNSVAAGVDNNCNGLDEDCDNKFDEGWLCPDANNDQQCDECTDGGTICMGVPKCVAGDVICEGDPVGTETCNCLNDDCDANTDEGTNQQICPGGGACVNCQCAFECTNDEFPCPVGKRCEMTPNGNYCVNDPCFNVTCPVPTSGAQQTCRPKAAFPNEYECVDTCSTINCSGGFVCFGPAGECRPDDCTTFPERCAANENCIAGTCVVNPCQGVTCDGGTYCVGGECVSSCADVTCPSGQRCRMGACEDDPCDKQCPFGQACNDNTGECIEDPCKFRECNTGQWCNPNSGQCEEDACVSSEVTCPNAGEICRGGSCIDPNDTGPDASTGTFVTVGGGGCSTSDGNTSVWFMLAMVGGFMLRRRRRVALQLATPMIALVLASAQLSCNVNQYCVGCEVDDAGGGGSDMDALDDSNGSGGDDVMIDAGCLPTGPEICDGTDNDCDGLVDNGTLPQVGTACDNVEGACAGGLKECFQGNLRCDKRPMPEICDLIDNNCNGMTDEGDPGGGGKCGTDQGNCVAGTNHCNTTTGQIECQGFIDTRTAMEECDGEDDDCDTDIDEDVGNLGTCGPATDVGECEFGTLICQGGGTVCSNAKFPAFELCNGLDDDCDGLDDEIFDTDTDPRNCGACGNVCPTPSRTCINSSTPSVNGTTCTSSTTCAGGTCAINSQVVCAPNMQSVGTCDFTCNPGFIDLDTMPGNGCEYRCFATGQEVCDGIDNDCDGMIDNGMTPPAICLSGGECGVTAPVAQCMGAQGWRCTYPGNTQFPETRCDGLNNDCDANVDENQPNLNQACDDGRTGVCKGTGVFACNTTSELTRNGPATCNVTVPGQAVGDAQETCDDKDNDCDGKTDEGAETGNLLGQDWVTIGGGRQVMKYEASRQDTSSTQQGTKSGTVAATIAAAPTGATQSGSVATFTTTAAHGLTAGTKVRVSGVSVSGYNGLWTIATVPTTTSFTATVATTGLANAGGGTVSKFIGACSKAGAMPWTNVTYPEALAVCESMGASLCSETRWHQACSVVAPVGLPITIDNGTGATSGTTIQAEDFFRNVANGGPETACTGSTDDDNDGLANDGCPAVSSGGGPETACNDAVDSDGDGRVNDGCPVQEEGGETGTQCDNNTDDDGDGRDNDGCPETFEGGETICTGTSNNDEDGDGRANDGCPAFGTRAETGNECNNNQDDDGDGRDNDGCPAVLSGVGPETGAQCNNNSDDDGDGRDNDGCPVVIQGAGPETNCTNSTDDDGDGFVNDGCPEFIGGAETGAQCAPGSGDDDGDNIANDGCPAVGPHSWQEDFTPANSNLTFPQAHLGLSNMRALPNFGATYSLGNALAQAPYLEYQVNIQTAATYRVWVRMYSPAGVDDMIHVGLSTSATAVAPTATLITSVNGSWVWMNTDIVVSGTGTHYLRLFMGDDGVKVDAIFIGRTSTPQPPCPAGSTSATASCTLSDGGTWSYAMNPDTYQPSVCNGADFSGANDNVLTTGTRASCYADHDGAGTTAHVFDMSGNVKEWTLARLPGQNPIRGGASNDTATGISCNLNFILGTDTFFFPNVGFRCCR